MLSNFGRLGLVSFGQMRQSLQTLPDRICDQHSKNSGMFEAMEDIREQRLDLYKSIQEYLKVMPGMLSLINQVSGMPNSLALPPSNSGLHDEVPAAQSALRGRPKPRSDGQYLRSCLARSAV